MPGFEFGDPLDEPGQQAAVLPKLFCANVELAFQVAYPVPQFLYKLGIKPPSSLRPAVRLVFVLPLSSRVEPH